MLEHHNELSEFDYESGVPFLENRYYVPIWEKYALSVEEASVYFHIGQNKLRDFIKQNDGANWILVSGNRSLIKRELFKSMLDGCSVI